MTAYALISGTLHRAPERRTSKAGKSFVTATVKTREADASTFWRIVTFSESAGEELMALTEGDAVACQGSMKAELYRPEGGEARVSLSMVVDAILPAKGRPKRKDHGDDDRQPEPESKPSPARPSDWRAREGRRRSLAEQAGNGGTAHGYGHQPRHWGGTADPELNDPPF
ncbi:MAG: single-stranded DNA-binding protein [Hyphomicrobiales bacterium]|nr:MAG: single-stranded DNA-binding protein [Hyphomicrobiales bacterium]